MTKTQKQIIEEVNKPIRTYMATKKGGNDNWATPKWLIDLFKDYYDPCPLNPDFNIEINEDGLTTDWKEFTYINPPYSKVLPWVLKAVEEAKKGKIVVMLLRVDCSTEWYRQLVTNKAHILFFSERLHFNEHPQGTAFPSMLVILNNRIK